MCIFESRAGMEKNNCVQLSWLSTALHWLYWLKAALDTGLKLSYIWTHQYCMTGPPAFRHRLAWPV